VTLLLNIVRLCRSKLLIGIIIVIRVVMNIGLGHLIVTGMRIMEIEMEMTIWLEVG